MFLPRKHRCFPLTDLRTGVVVNHTLFVMSDLAWTVMISTKAVGGVTQFNSWGRPGRVVLTLLPRRPFGTRLAIHEAMESDEHQLASLEVMSVSVDSATPKYAVIQVSREPNLAARLVLAYRDEQSLRSFIAEPSIIARGFVHREEAAALVAGNLTKSIAPGGTEQEQVVNNGGSCRLRFPCWKRAWAAVLRGWNYRGLYGVVQFAFTSAILLVYSKNFRSSIIRTVLGI